MIRVVVQDENGNGVGAGVDAPADLLSHPDDARFKCLCFVDAYGDTVFNRLQMRALLEDIRLLRSECDSGRYEAVLDQIEALIRRCQAEAHLYVKLIGD